MIKVLVVDDSALMRKLLGQVFARDPDFEVQFAHNGLEALKQLNAFEPDVITLDVHMPQMDGLACLDRIMVERPCPVVMVSSLTEADADATLEAFRLGAVDFVAKPNGAISLYIEEMAAELLSKVRAAAGYRLKSSLRLKDRIRHRIGGKPTMAIVQEISTAGVAVTGDGIVVVGTSTGGPPALEGLLSGLPKSFPWPILIAQHMPQTFTGPLARRLDSLCALTVLEVQKPILLQPGCAYIGQGGADIVVSRRSGGLIASAASPDPEYLWHPSTDRLMRSAMKYLPPSQLIGILMTGMGNDGAKAMALLRANGGRTIAEAEETAVVWGMPGELVRLGGAEFIVPLSGIANQLRKLLPACR